ncbi:hypothetical protein HMPREF9471_04997, partial [[Clostridium] clostridioforme WAL-7855]
MQAQRINPRDNNSKDRKYTERGKVQN